ncbi:MAG: hypothetical protein IPF95_01095 [Flavobacteriales bacterium]|nr:hypothetical protein [Flavobacteriales bacterium]MBK6946551.1 hypothetical protein [Flavobacteriales bacterium]MBP9138407.1 hypothetical protein [Flavobacteriales bacterium]HQV53664.1 glutamate--tRNA ligase family protein [Flavobacteriales bacterium]HQZ42040.1 glutamate--tRNA ligase family protein [Flavobacteriales bacterium]
MAPQTTSFQLEDHDLPRGGRTRIAPTPSGYLHAGNAINFLITSKLAQVLGSSIHLRIDDLDAERVRTEYVEDIFRSLDWLGIEWQSGPTGPDDHLMNWSQQMRLERYGLMAKELRSTGLVYGCTCTRSQLQEHNAEGRYPGTCRSVGHSLEALENTWRLHVMDPTMIEINGLNGRTELVDLVSVMGDPVIRQRSVGNEMPRVAYQLASLADDLDQGITWIVRGKDLLASTACQLHIADLLGLEQFEQVRFLHHRLEMDDEGRKLSKSDGATSLKAMRKAGVSPQVFERKADMVIREFFSP